MQKALFLIMIALSSAACSSSDEFGRKAGLAPAETAQASASAQSDQAVSKGPVNFVDNADQDGASRKFTYSWPAAVSAEPGLARSFIQDRDRLLAEQKGDWQQMQGDGPQNCTSCRSLELSKQWQVVANVPGWLSLSADIYAFTGGAHGISDRQSLVWDRAAGKAIKGIDMFRSPSALGRALGPGLCQALDKQREKKRGAPVSAPDGPGDSFNACPQVREATVLIGSSTGQKFNRIGIWFGPYVAGSYSEGSYELTFPVDAKIREAVRPEYAAAFAIMR